MVPPQDSTDTEQAPKDTTSHAVEEKSLPPHSGQLHEIARDRLESALGEDAPSEKDYHIREALQALVIATDHRLN